MHPWYLLYCKQGYKVTANRIRSLGIEVFQPMMVRIEYKKSKRLKKETKNMFPSYLFLSFDFNQIQISDIKKIPGVVSFVRFGEQPCVVPFKIIESLKLRNPSICKKEFSIEYLNLRDDHVLKLETFLDKIRKTEENSPSTTIPMFESIFSDEREIKLLKILEEIETAKKSIIN